MDNKNVIITVGIVASLGIVTYLAYTMIKASKPVVPASKKQIATASKNVAQTKAALAKNPSDPALQAAYAVAANAFSQALSKGLSSIKIGGGGSSKSPTGVSIVTVSKDGSYVEKGDPYTLYNKDGSVKGDLDSSTGMFVNKNGKTIAAADGTPVKVNSDGSYSELDDNGNVTGNFDRDGNEIIPIANNDNSGSDDEPFDYGDWGNDNSGSDDEPFDYGDWGDASGHKSAKKSLNSLLKRC